MTYAATELDDADLRAVLHARLREDPDLILGDRALMRALVAAEETSAAGPVADGKIVDLRGVAMARLEQRLDRLEETHRAVIAAAYDNLAGTAQIHRAVLALMSAQGFEALLERLGGEVADILRVDAVRLVLESAALTSAGDPGRRARQEALGLEARLGPLLMMRPAGFGARYAGETGFGARPAEGAGRADGAVILRPVTGRPDGPFDEMVPAIASEAILRLNIGPGRQPALLALGAVDPHRFTPAHGTDLLAFLGGALGHQVGRYLG